MDRRKSIKTLLVGTAAAAVLIESCDTPVKNSAENASNGLNEDDRMAEEKIANKKLRDEIFFIFGAGHFYFCLCFWRQTQ